MKDCERCKAQKSSGKYTRQLVLLIVSSSVIFISLLTKIFELALIAYALSGFEVLKKTFKNFAKLRFFNEYSLMSIATVGALFLREFPEAAVVMVLYRFGELLERYVVDRSGKEMKKLLFESPRYAWKIEDNELKKVHVNELKVEDVVFVRVGEKVPSDGIVVEGVAEVDLSHLTGESFPKTVTVMDEVYAGSIVINGNVKVRISKSFEESSMARLAQLIENAKARKAKAERFITLFAKYYTPIVVLTAALLLFILPTVFKLSFSASLYRALILLVISCPCALVLSVPLTYVAGLGKASKNGIFVKGAEYLDAVANVKNVVFDKTATLTQPKLELASIEPHNGFSKDEVLFFAAHAGLSSNHPLARTISDSFKTNHTLLREPKEFVGLGVKAFVKDRLVHLGNDRFLHEENIEHPESVCKLDTKAVHVSVDRLYAGTLTFKEKLKDSALETVERLKRAGLKVYIMSGDSKSAVQEISMKLGGVSYFAELKPEDKLTLLEEKILEEGTTMFVGDGVNDTPALSRADVGVAMNSLGNDAALEVADAVVMSGEPAQVWQLISIGRNTRKIVLQNIVLAIGVKVFFIVLAMMGKSTMWQGVFADTGVMVLCALNSFRLFAQGVKFSSSRSRKASANNI